MELGQVIGGKYRLLRLLGDGGMGSVYEAHHEVLGSLVAIKVLHEDLAQRPELVDRFLREARVLAQIANPHVVRVLDIAMAEAGHSAYIVMDLLAGEPLSAVLRRERRLPLAVAVSYATQVLDALVAAHALSVVHRDLKPENVFITREGEHTIVKVIDFGIAKAGSLGGASANLTVSGALMGTPEYMAPEQAHSADRADARSDIFAVGVLLYEMISGSRPVDGEDPRVVAMKVEKGEVTPLIHRVPEVPRELAGLVHRAMAARPELRFASAAEMRSALEGAMGAKRASTPPAGEAVRAPVRTDRPPATPASVAPPAGPALTRATGTVLVGPGPKAQPAAAGQSPGQTDPGGEPLFAAQGGPAPAGPLPQPGPQGPAWAPSGVAGPRHETSFGNAPQGRGRPRNSGGLLLILVAVALVGGGVALAFAFTGSSKPQVVATRPSATTADSQTPVATTPSPDVSIDPSLPSLPVPGGGAPHPIVSPTPRGSSAPPSPSSVASGVPSNRPPGPDNPYGIPSLPFLVPTAWPNPFPSPAASGVGPVTNFPTIPGLFAPNEPAPPAPAPSHKPGK